MIVDVHAHCIPPRVIEGIRRGTLNTDAQIETKGNGQEWVRHKGGSYYPLRPEFVDVEAILKDMDRSGIDRRYLSAVPSLFLYGLPREDAVALCRLYNDSLAALVARDPNRLGALATVPLGYPDEAVKELERATKELGLEGVEIGTHTPQYTLDHPDLRPFFQRCEALGVPILIHPYDTAGYPMMKDYYLLNFLGNPTATTSAASRLIFSGLMRDLPNLRVILVHGGGFLPYQLGRLDHGARVRPEAENLKGVSPSEFARKFYCDTITFNASALRFLVERMGPFQVVVGTDFPFDMADTDPVRSVKEAQLAPDVEAMVLGGNAQRLFPRAANKR